MGVTTQRIATGDSYHGDVIVSIITLYLYFTDGRNHAPCCFRRRIPQECLGLCSNDFPSVIDQTNQHCISRAEDMLPCFTEGRGTSV